MALSRTSSTPTSPAAAAAAGQSEPPRARRTRPPALDEICVAAVELARKAAIEEAGDESLIGEHVGVEAEAERLVVHRFRCLSSAYVGWEWAVTVTRAARAKVATVDDATLLPGRGALVAPAWVPWSERLRPGDLGVGDLLPTAADDPRLALRAADVERLSDDELYIELELGRPRVLSFDGRLDAAERWLAGEPGPESALARAAPARCRTCGFHVRLVGALGRVFGVCANEFAPDDSRVTSFDHGCGAHSEALVLPSVHPQPVRLDDDTELELVTPKTPDETRTEALAGASDDVPAAAPAGVVAQEPEDTLAAGPEVSSNTGPEEPLAAGPEVSSNTGPEETPAAAPEVSSNTGPEETPAEAPAAMDGQSAPDEDAAGEAYGHS